MRAYRLLSVAVVAGCTATMVSAPGSTAPSPNAPVNEAQRPGVIKYLNQGAQSVKDQRRADAYKQMHDACKGPYKIDAEGPRVDGSTVVGVAPSPVYPAGGAVSEDTQYWYIQFSCVRDAK